MMQRARKRERSPRLSCRVAARADRSWIPGDRSRWGVSRLRHLWASLRAVRVAVL